MLRLWQLDPPNQLNLLAEARGHSRAINSVAFSLNDKQVVSAGEDGSVCIWWIYE